MKRIPLFRPFAQALALSLCLAAPAARAVDGPQNAVRQPPADSAARKASAAPPQVLTAEEIQELARRAEEPGPEAAGGALSNLHLTYVVIALAAAVIVLIAK